MTYQWKDPSGFTRVVQVLVAIVLVIMAGQLLLTLTTGSASTVTGAETEFTGPQIIRVLLDLVALIRLPVSVVVLFWFRRLNINAHTFGRHMTIGPTGAMLWFFVPIASFFVPYQMVQELWSVSGGDQKTSRMILLWWILFLVEAVLGLVFGIMSQLGAGNPGAVLGISDAFGLVGGILFVILAGRLSTQQKQAQLAKTFTEEVPQTPLQSLQNG